MFRRAGRQLCDVWSSLGDLVFSYVVTLLGERSMKGLVNLLVRRLAVLALPLLVQELNNVLEELIQADLNGDGVIGDGDDDVNQ